MIPPQGLSVRHLSGVGIDDPSWRKVIAGPAVAWRLWRLLRRERFDVVVAHMERACMLLALTPCAAPKILTIHNFLGASLGGKTPIKRLNAEILYRRVGPKAAARVVCVSRAAAHDAGTRFPGLRPRIAAIPNFIAVDAVEAMSRQPLPDDARTLFAPGETIVSVGRLIGQKGHWHLIRAFAEVVRRRPAARLIILGDGPLQARLADYAAALGVADRVALPGFRPNPFAWIRAADVFALPSLYEGMPMILIEALACGTPIVSADCPSGPREILSPDTPVDDVARQPEEVSCGWLLPRFDDAWTMPESAPSPAETALAEVLLRVLDHPGTGARMAAAARVRAAEFDTQTGARRWQDLLAACVAS
jgi:glycosyltransferase involved in cell wall biosynthesis